MTATRFYRIAAVILLLFAILHTFGFLKFKPPSAEGLAVRDGMDHVFFEIGGAKYSYGNFYRGFGLFITAYLAFSAYLAWHLGTLANSHPGAIGALGWMFVLVQVASLVLGCVYFSWKQASFAGLAAVVLFLARWRLRL